MRHPTPSAMRAACATLLVLSAAACAPGAEPAKACAADTTIQGLKTVLFSAASKGVDGVSGQGWASLQNVQLALDLPRLSAVDRTTKKISCEGRLTTTAPAAAPGQTPQRVTEDATYTVQPSAREGETVYEVAAAPGTIGLIHAALVARAKPAAGSVAVTPSDYGPLGAPQGDEPSPITAPDRQLAEFRRYQHSGPTPEPGGGVGWQAALQSDVNERALLYKAWIARPDLIQTSDKAGLRKLEKRLLGEACENYLPGATIAADSNQFIESLLPESALAKCPKQDLPTPNADPGAT